MEKSAQFIGPETQLTPESLLEELRNYSKGLGTPGHDERIASFSFAAVLEYKKEGPFKDVLDEFVYTRTDIKQPSLAVNILLRAVQKQLLRRDTLDARANPYPEPYERVLPWGVALRSLSERGTPEYNDLLDDLHNRTPQSNIVERYKSLALIIQLMRGQFDRRPNLLDIGCSQNHGLKRLGLRKEVGTLPFRDIEVVGQGGIEDKRRKSRVLNTLLQYSHDIGDSIGVDIKPLDDPKSKEWAYACSFYPSELLDSRRVANYDLLDAAEPTEPRISFYQADFANLSVEHLAETLGQPAVDMASVITLLSQVSQPEKRQRILDNARSTLKPHGLLVVQDFVHVDQKDFTNLQFYKNWFLRPYRYRTCIAEGSDGFQKFYEIMRWDNGRCNKVQLTHHIGRLALADKFELIT